MQAEITKRDISVTPDDVVIQLAIRFPHPEGHRGRREVPPELHPSIEALTLPGASVPEVFQHLSRCASREA